MDHFGNKSFSLTGHSCRRHIGLVLFFFKLWLRCVNVSVNFNSFLPDEMQLWPCCQHGPQLYLDGKGLIPVFFYAHVIAYEVLGPCHGRQALQHGVCAGLMGAHPSFIF